MLPSVGAFGDRCGWLLVWALMLSSAACSSDELTPSEAIAACERDPTSMCCGPGACGQGSECDFSVVCGQGADHRITCDAPKGDRQCHPLCGGANAACGTGQVCQQVTIFDTSDGGRAVSFCKAP